MEYDLNLALRCWLFDSVFQGCCGVRLRRVGRSISNLVQNRQGEARLVGLSCITFDGAIQTKEHICAVLGPTCLSPVHIWMHGHEGMHSCTYTLAARYRPVVEST